MAGELQFSYAANRQAYCIIRNATASVWSNSGGIGGLETYDSDNYAEYVVEAVEEGTDSAFYLGDFPSNAPPGQYSIVAKHMVDVAPSELDPAVAIGALQWGVGSAVMPLSNVMVSGQLATMIPLRLARGQMLQNFPFKMVSSVDHITPYTSGANSFSGQISRDGGAFGVLQSGAFTEVGMGHYVLNGLTSGDMLASGTVALHIGAISGCDPRDFAFIINSI